jgi:hypothetical protein
VVYLLLAACLFPEVGYPGVWRKLTAGLDGIRTATPTAGPLAQARRRVGVAPLRWLFDLSWPEDLLGQDHARRTSTPADVLTSSRPGSRLEPS